MISVNRLLDDVLLLQQSGVNPETLRDDGARWIDKTVEKPWGYEREIYRAGAVSITRLVLNPGAETSLHCHPNKDAVLIVEEGSCILETLVGTVAMDAGESAQIQRGAFHRTRTAKGCALVEVESPANKRDLVRLNDRYGRGQGYESR